MRILYFSRDYTPHDHRFLAALAGSRHQVVYLRLERRNPPRERRELPPEVQLVEWAGGSKPARLRDLPRLLASLKRVIADLQPDLIHAGPVPTVGFLAALSGFQPLVLMSWGSDLLRDIDRNPFQRWAARYALRRSQVLLGDCQAVRDKGIQLGFPAERIVTFPWGVDLAQFSPGDAGGLRQQLGWEKAFVLLHTRAWEPLYGVEEMALGFVRAAHQHPELRLLLLNGGSLRKRLEAIFKAGGVSERVHFAGQVAQAELPRYYRAADLYLSASHSDGSSVSLMEALACGTPALVSDIPGNREWITPGEHGWLFPVSDAQALAQGITQALEQRSRLPEMGRAARALAEQRADWTKNFQRLLGAYDVAIRLAEVDR